MIKFVFSHPRYLLLSRAARSARICCPCQLRVGFDIGDLRVVDRDGALPLFCLSCPSETLVQCFDHDSRPSSLIARFLAMLTSCHAELAARNGCIDIDGSDRRHVCHLRVENLLVAAHYVHSRICFYSTPGSFWNWQSTTARETV